MYKLVRLNFGRSPTHFGETGIGLEATSERVRSDSLFSAWVSSYARLYGGKAVEALLNRFDTDTPPFRLSSTFVYRRNPQQSEQFIDYLPKPIQRPVNYPTGTADELAIAKTYKRLHYLPLSIWQRWYQGEGFTQDDYDALTTYDTSPDDKQGELGRAGAFDYGQASKRYELPKVAIDRATRATNFFHTGLNQFDWRIVEDTENKQQAQNLAGLYFLIDLPEDDAELEADLKGALALLGEDGMGGERSSGAGRFEVLSWQEISEKVNPLWHQLLTHESAYHSLISLYWEYPVPETLLGEAACYSLLERGGWIASPSGRQLRRKKVYMFGEGSVFDGEPKGRLADVTPEQFRAHRIYRSGVAISLPIKVGA